MTEANRQFAQGEQVRVARKSRVVDEARECEGVAPKTLPPIDQDVTGAEGEVYGESYVSEAKGGEIFTPLLLRSGAVISVPERRLERADRSVRKMDGGGQIGGSPVSRNSVEFWREYFRKNGEIKTSEAK